MVYQCKMSTYLRWTFCIYLYLKELGIFVSKNSGQIGHGSTSLTMDYYIDRDNPEERGREYIKVADV